MDPSSLTARSRRRLAARAARKQPGAGVAPARRRLRAAVACVLGALVLSLGFGAALAAAAKPDAHDRALAARLDAKVATFRAIAARTSGGNSTKSLNSCAYLKKHPKDAFAAVFALLPALLAQVVNEYRPQLTDLRDTVVAMHPDSPLFRQWLAATGESFGLILTFDNHGKKIDLCRAAQVMLSKTSTPADVKRVLGIDPALVATLFSRSSTEASTTITKLNPKMRAFLVAAGVSRRNAVAMTTSS